MKIRPTKSGGRVIEGDTPYGEFRFEVNESGVLTNHSVVVRDPKSEKPAPPFIRNPALVDARKRICLLCPRNMGVTEYTVKCQSCKSCGNNLSFSTGVCPENKWESTDSLNVPAAADFKHVVVVNLKRRNDRLIEFNKRIKDMEWPFAQPIPFPAVDGSRVRGPEWFKSGIGAWGCYRSHLNILESALNEKLPTLAVFEDDAMFVPDFASKLADFLKALPPDWEQAYLGGQLLKKNEQPPVKVNECVIKPFNVNRTHAYLLRGLGIQKVYEWLCDTVTWQRDFPQHHVDHRMGKLHESGTINVYAPVEWLVGQAAGGSDVNGKRLSPRFFS